MTVFNMVLLMRGEQNGQTGVKFVPATWDEETKQGEILQETPDFRQFITDAIAALDFTSQGLVLNNAKALRDEYGTELSDEGRADLYVRLLAAFSERPMELVGNQLASMFVTCIESAMVDPDLDQLVSEYESAISESE